MASIDWRAFSVDVQERWKRPVDMKADIDISQSTLMDAWHGKPVGVFPMLKACAAMGANPLRYLSDYDAPPRAPRSEPDDRPEWELRTGFREEDFA